MATAVIGIGVPARIVRALAIIANAFVRISSYGSELSVDITFGRYWIIVILILAWLRASGSCQSQANSDRQEPQELHDALLF